MTLVSKSHPTIKKLLVVTVGSNFKGRKIYVDEVDPIGWTYHYINDTGEPKVFIAKADGASGFEVPRPGYGQSKQLPFPNDGRLGEVFMTYRRGDSDMITIYVPRFDAAVLDVARDARLIGPSQKANLTRQLKESFGAYAGIAEAVLDSEKKTLEAVTEGKKSSRQLDREIDEFMRERRR